MNLCEVKRLFGQARGSTALVDSLVAQADRYRWLAFRIGGQRFDAIRVNGSNGDTDRVGNAVMQLLEAEARLTQRAEDELRLAGKAENLIGLVDDPVMRAIVRKRVLLREGWRQIGQAEGICYDERHCQRLYGKALVEIAKKTGG